MLRISTVVKNSHIPRAGMGLFCTGPVAKDTLIWAFDEGLDYRVHEWPLDVHVWEFLAQYAYLQIDGTPGHVVCADNARFMNHEGWVTASCYVWLDGRTYAARDLEPNTELTHDYNTFCADDPITGWKRGDGPCVVMPMRELELRKKHAAQGTVTPPPKAPPLPLVRPAIQTSREW